MISIMLVTSEWSQRNGMVTFTLEPRRSRIVVAKFLAGIALALGGRGARRPAGGARHPARASSTGERPDWSLDGNLVFNASCSQMIGMIAGFALAMLLMNTPAAIVPTSSTSFVLPDRRRDPRLR